MSASTASRAALKRLLGPALLAYLRADVSGHEHVPSHGPFLLAPNHLSFLDHFLLWAASPRLVHFLGKAELARGVGGRINVAMGMVPIERGVADRDALQRVAVLLEQGHPVAVFPEGTRSATGELFRFRGGIARLAAASQVPVVPVGLAGTSVVWPRGASRPAGRPQAGVVSVRFGEALAPPADNGADRRDLLERLWHAVAALSGQPTADRFAPITDGQDSGTGGVTGRTEGAARYDQ